MKQVFPYIFPISPNESWVSNPGTGPDGFVSKTYAILMYLCVRSSDMHPERTEIAFETPLSKRNLKVWSKFAGYECSRSQARHLHWRYGFLETRISCMAPPENPPHRILGNIYIWLYQILCKFHIYKGTHNCHQEHLIQASWWNKRTEIQYGARAENTRECECCKY